MRAEEVEQQSGAFCVSPFVLVFTMLGAFETNSNDSPHWHTPPQELHGCLPH